MRVLLVADLHYRLRQLDWLVAAAPGVDVVVIAGDLLDIRSPVPLDVQAVAVSAALRVIGASTLLVVASGNHDLDRRDAVGEKTAGWLGSARTADVHVDGEALLAGGDLFTICPWWDGPLGRVALDEQLALDAARERNRWIWVHHAPPSGSPLAWDGRRAFGDEALTGWISRYRPDIVLAGHVHQAPFVRGGAWADRIDTTWVFNPGQQHGGAPTHILLDLDAGTAVWRSAEGREEIALQ